MSQEKVDRYKKEKANREKTVKRQKLMHRLEMTLLTLVCAGIVVWVGFSLYRVTVREDEPETTVTELDADAISSYMETLSDSTDAGE